VRNKKGQSEFLGQKFQQTKKQIQELHSPEIFLVVDGLKLIWGSPQHEVDLTIWPHGLGDVELVTWEHTHGNMNLTIWQTGEVN
jgi:hypothetical protein